MAKSAGSYEQRMRAVDTTVRSKKHTGPTRSVWVAGVDVLAIYLRSPYVVSATPKPTGRSGRRWRS